VKCPRTGERLSKLRLGQLEVDVSPGCAGVWFDRFELSKVDDLREVQGEVLVEHLSEQSHALLNTATRLRCPRDTDVVMMRRYFSPKGHIEIDECPACGGIWLDAGELEAIRGLFANAADRKEASEAFARAVMSSPEAQKHERESQDFIRRLERISALLWSVLGVHK
jgi:Zn-finger nucleic acid-binding protein